MKKLFFITMLTGVFLNCTFGQTNHKASAIAKTAMKPANTVYIEGIIVPASQSQVFGTPNARKITISVGCCCVTMPCDCDGDGEPDHDIKPPIMFQISKTDLVKTVQSNKRTVSGKKVSGLYIKKTAVVEGPVFSQTGKNKVAKIKAQGLRGPKSSSPTSSPAAKFIIDDIVEAFTFGWHIGETIDHEFGITNWLSDLWIDGFGPIEEDD